jgi:hypothetical protein
VANPNFFTFEVADQNGVVKHSVKVQLGQTVTLQLIPKSGTAGTGTINTSVR